MREGVYLHRGIALRRTTVIMRDRIGFRYRKNLSVIDTAQSIIQESIEVFLYAVHERDVKRRR